MYDEETIDEFCLQYLAEGAGLIQQAIENEEHITVYGDYDFDGLVCLMLFKRLFNILGYTNFTLVRYSKRTHSIDKNVSSIVLEHNSGLCIICDTGSSEPEVLKYINSRCNVLVLDHHRGTLTKSIITDSLVVINPVMWEDDLKMSAGCVSFEVIMKWVKMYRDEDDYEFFENSLAFYPFASIYGDGAYGYNDYCYSLYHKALNASFPPEFSYAQRNFSSSKRFVLFSVAPPINAAFRNNRLDLINKLFLSEQNLVSYERADLLDDLEILRSEMRAHINQLHDIVKPVMLGNFCLVDLTGYLNQSISNEIIWANKGLIANKIAETYKCACVSIVKAGDKYTLSVRDYYNRDILSLMSPIYHVGGHPSAFGGVLEVHDVLNIKRVLTRLSSRLEAPRKKVVQILNRISMMEINDIAMYNEFAHPSDVIIVEVNKRDTKLEKTPASWGEQYYQYHVKLQDGNIVYVKQENFDTPSKSVLYVQLYKGNRLSGTMVDMDRSTAMYAHLNDETLL